MKTKHKIVYVSEKEMWDIVDDIVNNTSLVESSNNTDDFEITNLELVYADKKRLVGAVHKLREKYKRQVKKEKQLIDYVDKYLEKEDEYKKELSSMERAYHLALIEIKKLEIEKIYRKYYIELIRLVKLLLLCCENNVESIDEVQKVFKSFIINVKELDNKRIKEEEMQNFFCDLETLDINYWDTSNVNFDMIPWDDFDGNWDFKDLNWVKDSNWQLDDDNLNPSIFEDKKQQSNVCSDINNENKKNDTSQSNSSKKENKGKREKKDVIKKRNKKIEDMIKSGMKLKDIAKECDTTKDVVKKVSMKLKNKNKEKENK